MNKMIELKEWPRCHCSNYFIAVHVLKAWKTRWCIEFGNCHYRGEEKLFLRSAAAEAGEFADNGALMEGA